MVTAGSSRGGHESSDRPSRKSLRTVIADDSDDIRALLRISLGQDDHFEIVGEAADGYEAVQTCKQLWPDLLLLDRQMPRMGGLDAIPLIRRESPWTRIVLYSAAVAPGDREAAVAAGAIGVMDKAGAAHDIAEELTQRLIGQRAPEPDTVDVRVGPVPSVAARAWIANTRNLLSALSRQPEVIGGPIADHVMTVFEQFLDAWESVARDTEQFFWMGRAARSDLRDIIEEWARIDSMDDTALAVIGGTWAPPEARPFFDSLTGGIIGALAEDDGTRRLAEGLGANSARRLS